jgi:Golgi phosphoprotein 3
MLTLPEELMLLALRDDKGSVIFSASTALPYGLAGAVLLELFFKGKITYGNKKIQVIDKSIIDDPVLNEALNLMKNSSKDRNPKYWIQKINSKVKKLKQRVIDNLIAQQILNREGHKILWFFNIDRYPTLDVVPEMEIRTTIRNIVLNDYDATEREIALLSLMKACSLINEVFQRSERKLAKKKIKELLENQKMSKDVSSAVNAITQEITAAIVSVVVVAHASHSS